MQNSDITPGPGYYIPADGDTPISEIQSDRVRPRYRANIDALLDQVREAHATAVALSLEFAIDVRDETRDRDGETPLELEDCEDSNLVEALRGLYDSVAALRSFLGLPTGRKEAYQEADFFGRRDLGDLAGQSQRGAGTHIPAPRQELDRPTCRLEVYHATEDDAK